MSALTDAQMLALAQEDRGPQFHTFIIVMIVLTIFAISLRFISRGLRSPEDRHQSRFWWDDWIALAAVLPLLSEFALAIVLVNLGLGHHTMTLPFENITPLLKVLFAAQLLYDINLFLLKTSALLFFSRIFPSQTGTWFRIGLWLIHGLNTAWLLGNFIGTFFLCSPIQRFWLPLMDGTCNPTSMLWIGSAVPSVIIDFLILVLPMPIIWGLRASRMRKSGITIIFVLGYSVIVVSIGRLITISETGAAMDQDVAYESIPALYWLCVEGPVTLFSICIPAMVNLGRRLVTTFFSPLWDRIASALGIEKHETMNSTSGKYLRSKNTTDKSKASVSYRNPTDVEAVSLQSFESGQRRLYVSPTQDFYEARVQIGKRGGIEERDIPDQYIRVENDINISRQVQRQHSPSHDFYPG
ncbi:hypothetical protein F4677DRAFT_450169 [Hypoxylon crocopeplum]|nr:hypothetical protein F4677DRAFT_450169 [Hypoxylon crocopeplum]